MLKHLHAGVRHHRVISTHCCLSWVSYNLQVVQIIFQDTLDVKFGEAFPLIIEARWVFINCRPRSNMHWMWYQTHLFLVVCGQMAFVQLKVLKCWHILLFFPHQSTKCCCNGQWQCAPIVLMFILGLHLPLSWPHCSHLSYNVSV